MMIRIDELHVGDLVFIAEQFFNSKPGTFGVVYEEYDTGCSIINQDGNYCGFNYAEGELSLLGVFLLVPNRPLSKKYDFKTVMQLSHDFHSGIFDSDFQQAFTVAKRKFENSGAYFLWDFERNQWWKAGRGGYTRTVYLAGEYSLDDAMQICVDANRYQGRGDKPNTAIVPIEHYHFQLKDECE